MTAQGVNPVKRRCRGSQWTEGPVCVDRTWWTHSVLILYISTLQVLRCWRWPIPPAWCAVRSPVGALVLCPLFFIVGPSSLLLLRGMKFQKDLIDRDPVIGVDAKRNELSQPYFVNPFISQIFCSLGVFSKEAGSNVISPVGIVPLATTWIISTTNQWSGLYRRVAIGYRKNKTLS